MHKITVGRTRKKSNTGTVSAADAVFVFGAAAVCVMLTLPLLTVSGESVPPSEESAVMVMSGAVMNTGTPEREELAAPSGIEEEEWSFYDYIGELFAGLISGRG